MTDPDILLGYVLLVLSMLVGVVLGIMFCQIRLGVVFYRQARRFLRQWIDERNDYVDHFNKEYAQLERQLAAAKAELAEFEGEL